MEPVGYHLINTETGDILQSWGGIYGQDVDAPHEIRCPNGDIVCAPEVDVDYAGVKIIRWEMDAPASIPIPTPEEKLAALGLTVDDLKTLLGLQ